MNQQPCSTEELLEQDRVRRAQEKEFIVWVQQKMQKWGEEKFKNSAVSDEAEHTALPVEFSSLEQQKWDQALTQYLEGAGFLRAQVKEIVATVRQQYSTQQGKGMTRVQKRLAGINGPVGVIVQTQQSNTVQLQVESDGQEWIWVFAKKKKAGESNAIEWFKRTVKNAKGERDYIQMRNANGWFVQELQYPVGQRESSKNWEVSPSGVVTQYQEKKQNSLLARWEKDAKGTVVLHCVTIPKINGEPLLRVEVNQKHGETLWRWGGGEVYDVFGIHRVEIERDQKGQYHFESMIPKALRARWNSEYLQEVLEKEPVQTISKQDAASVVRKKRL